MPKRLYLIICMCLLLVPWSVSKPSQDPAPAPKPQGKNLKVTISYQGKGKVDKSHGVYLFLFDSPDFVQNPGSVMPIGFQSVFSNDESVTFPALTAANVYLVAAFDEGGTYSPASGAPPSGTPVALYKPGDPQVPTPIKLDESKDVEIKFSFDDSFRMP